jgi:hypothetical protein
MVPAPRRPLEPGVNTPENNGAQELSLAALARNSML